MLSQTGKWVRVEHGVVETLSQRKVSCCVVVIDNGGQIMLAEWAEAINHLCLTYMSTKLSVGLFIDVTFGANIVEI